MAQPRTLDIYWIDVEGGAATLIVTPAGESILIDAGENLDRDASRIYRAASQVAGLKQIDHFVATHWHADHYGGAMKLNQLIPLRHFYDHGGVPASLPEDPNFPTLMPAYRKLTGGHSVALKPGDVMTLKQAPGLPALAVECIASGKKVVSGGKTDPANPVCSKKKAGPPDESDNANSIVLKLKYGNFAFFDGGDLTWEMEEKLVCPTDRAGTVDLLQTDHHGLDLSNNPVLIESLRPRVVVVNNGPRKGAEENCMKTLKRLPGIETIWQVHRNVRTSPELNTHPQFIANPEADCEAEFIKASVQANGAFSVRIGPNGTRRDYSPRK